MKTAVGLVVVAIFAACTPGKEAQVSFEDVKLVKIDTIFRNQMNQIVLTWKCKQDVQLVSFANVGQRYKIGSTYKVLFAR